MVGSITGPCSIINGKINKSAIFNECFQTCHPASRAFSNGTYALYREKALHESFQVLVEHAQRVAKIQFRTQVIHISRGYDRPVISPPCFSVGSVSTIGFS